jgi:hypothetical protein
MGIHFGGVIISEGVFHFIDDQEIIKVCEIISSSNRVIPLFLQPLTLPDGGVGVSPLHILRLQELASSRLPDVRVIPQMHKILGVL